MNEILVTSTLDGSTEPSLFHPADSQEPRPLLVGLHTWSYERHNQIGDLAPMAERNGWHLLLPEFRGPNNPANPRCREACGSQLARQDIVDAVEYVRTLCPVDAGNIFIAGGSGGGHMALLMAAYRPALWRTVFSFVPITDLKAWREQNPEYLADIEACCGGTPEEQEEEYRNRSPLSYAAELANSRTHIYHGKFDAAVAFSHSTRLFDRINELNPASNVFLHIFDGGHEMLYGVVESEIRKAIVRPVSGGQLTG